MRRTILRSLFACLIFVVSCLLLIRGGPIASAKQLKAVAQPVQGKAGDAAKDAAAKAASIEFISFPADRDAQQLLEAVQQYLTEARTENEKWDRICEAAQRVLDIKSDSFFEMEEIVEGEKKKSRVSVKVHANRLIGSFKPAGRQFYQLTYGPVAKQLLDEAVTANYDRTKLADVSQRYFHTTAGAEATLLLAGLYLDRGQYLEAAYAFDRYLTRPDTKEMVTPRTLFKAAVAFKRASDPTNAAKSKKYWDEFVKVAPRDGLAFGNRNFSTEELKTEFDRSTEMVYSRANELFVSMRYGNSSHTALGDGGTVFLDPTFSLSMVMTRTDINNNKSGYDWVRQNLDVALKRIGQQKTIPVIPGSFPLSAPSVLVFRNYSGIVCISAIEGVVGGKVRKPGDVVWFQPSSRSLVNEATLSESTLSSYWSYFQNTIPSLLFENPLVGSLSHDGKYVYFVDDLAVPPPPMMNDPNMGMGRVNMNMDGGLNGVSSPTLCAVNLETGKLLWELGGTGGGNTSDEQDDAATNPLALMQGAYFLGPPLPVNGKLYVLFEKNGKQRLACLDNERRITAADPMKSGNIPDLPSILWSQRLGEPKERLPNDSIRRFQCSYLAYADGVLICGTNTGAIVGIDVMSRSLLWAHSYRTRDGQADPNEEGVVGGIGRVRQRVIRGGVNGMGSTPLAQTRWRAAAPIVANGRVVVTAYDANVINCIDLRTGNLIWTDKMDAQDDLFVGGLINDRIIVIGSKKARAYDLNFNPSDPKVKKATPVWENLAIGLPCGHGVAAKNGLYYLPIGKSADSEMPQIWAINPAKGEVVSKTTFRRKLSASPEDTVPLGNLVFHEGQVFAQTPKELLAFPLIELKRKTMDELLRANPKDPAGLASRGELKLDDGKLLEAIADFKSAVAEKPSDSVRQRVREKMYQAYTELLRSNFSAGKPFLEEYRTLLELPLDSEDAVERQKIIDEQLKRKATYLSLMAKGTEKDGQLEEAFRYYREFATLGDNKQLIPIEGEAFGQVRPDVWARGRIDAMIRGAADPQKRKPLDALVTAEWQAVKSGNDLPKLREFVRVFGPYFSSGKEAQLVLAEKLLATSNEDDAKEAEGHLVQLLAGSSTDPSAGRAAEALARSMMRKNLFEDAVALYAQIGQRFETTVIRDGKTGADFLSDVLTDRRLLPYLEPSRNRTIGRAKVERKDEIQNRAVINGFFIEPEGDLLPFYRRFRFSVEMNSNSSQNWTLKVIDKTSGALRCKFDNLHPPSSFNIQPQTSWSDVKLAQANGHVVLLHFGLMVYCLDLAEKKMLWQYNLIGGQGTVNIRSQTTSIDGELSVMFEDGWMVRLGRSAVVRDSFVALLTRDGLVALDLVSGQKFWQLAAINPRSLLFGDNQYLIVADPGDSKSSNKEPVGKVIRAVDGTTVEGIPEFAKIVTSDARIKTIGRMILLFDGKKEKTMRLYDPIAGKNVWSKTYDENAKLVKCYDSSFVAVLSSNGKWEILDPETGAVQFSAVVDPVQFKDGLAKVTQPVLLSDDDRHYFVLNRPASSNNRTISYYGYNPIRSLAIEGPMICFDRANATELWATGRQLEGQQLVTDRFSELPVLLGTNNTYDQKTGMNNSEVVAIDKMNGKVKLKDNRLPPSGQFQSLEMSRNGTFELKRYDTKIVITPIDTAKE